MAGLGLWATPLVLLLSLPALDSAPIQPEDFASLLLSRSCADGLAREEKPGDPTGPRLFLCPGAQPSSASGETSFRKASCPRFSVAIDNPKLDGSWLRFLIASGVSDSLCARRRVAGFDSANRTSGGGRSSATMTDSRHRVRSTSWGSANTGETPGEADGLSSRRRRRIAFAGHL